ncbi:MAG: DegV family protein [Syntrophomonadaceae bacterium]|nr:DegV family protein [Syntrophomonadaceae bacterium]
MEEKIALVTDSSCDLPEQVIKEYGIHVLPLRVIYPSREYRDVCDITPQEVYARMSQEVPTTSQPPAGEIRELLARLKTEGFTKVLAIHISGGLSGTSDLVKSVSREFRNLETRVIDSKSLSMGLGFLVYEAARGVARGLNFQRILENIRAKQKTVRLFYVLETLEYLRRGGRLGLVAAALGGMLDLKPIISVNEEGKYFTFCKVRGRKKSVDKLVEVVDKAIAGKKVVAAVMHGGAPLEGEQLRKRIQGLSSGNIVELLFGQISPVLGVHTGPGLLGVCFYEA